MNVLQYLQVCTGNNMMVQSTLLVKAQFNLNNKIKHALKAAAWNNSFLFLSVIVVLILLHCGEDIKPAQQDFSQDYLFICGKMISRENEKQCSFLLGLQYMTARTTFQPTGKRRNLKTQCMSRIKSAACLKSSSKASFRS